ncbi:MAG: ROK family protein, partial [Deltaproteobacteria bacterium]
MSTDPGTDRRIVMTLDAGGTLLKFSAIQANRLLVGPVSLPWEVEVLEPCLKNIVEGFENIRSKLPIPPAAISFAFPGPADFPAGIISNVGNLPAFQGGVALGPFLEEQFGIPVFINNDGDLFAYGEALAGFLPYVNRLLEDAGNPKRYHNLFGLTLGTGLGGGIVRNGELFIGDNSAGGEAWLLRNKLDPSANAEEGASIRAVRQVYAAQCGLLTDQAPDPKRIFDIGTELETGNRGAAVEAFRRLGEVAGDALAQALTLVDGLAVIGGGIAGAHPLFLSALISSMNDIFEGNPKKLNRLIPRAFNLEDAGEREAFLRGDVR